MNDELELTEFVLWLNGAIDVSGEVLPTPEQWAIICEKSRAVLAQEVAKRLAPTVDPFMAYRLLTQRPAMTFTPAPIVPMCVSR